MNLGRAISALQKRLNMNDVKREYFRHLRHEDKGVKRRRLSSERWRRRFAHEVCPCTIWIVIVLLKRLQVRMKVKLVQEIRARRA